MKKIYYVSNLEEYLEVVRELNSESSTHKLWYRGQNNSMFGLTPGIFRKAYAIEDKFGNKINPPQPANFYNPKGEKVVMFPAQKLLRLFKEQVENKIEDIIKPKNDVQWLELAQHYGLPTLLLDWSTDPLVGLFFAISTISTDGEYEPIAEEEIYDSDGMVNEQIKDCASVWVINPLEINKITFNDAQLDRVINSSDDFQIIEREQCYPIGTFCFKGGRNNPRIVRQSGNFTYTCSGVTHTMDFIHAYQNELIKINIPYSSIAKLQQDLRFLDLTDESEYFGKTERDVVSLEIRKKVDNEFISSLQLI